MIGKCQILQVPQAHERTWKAVSDTVLETISPVLITKVVTRWDKALVPSILSPAASWERTCDSSEKALAVVYGYNDGLLDGCKVGCGRDV
jgi:hypothetical protein